MPSNTPPSSAPWPPSPARPPLELRVVVWYDESLAWRARVSGAGLVDREFASPFELARYVAWPPPPPTDGGPPGLR